jgi:hypothetical protein
MAPISGAILHETAIQFLDGPWRREVALRHGPIIAGPLSWKSPKGDWMINRTVIDEIEGLLRSPMQRKTRLCRVARSARRLLG